MLLFGWVARCFSCWCRLKDAFEKKTHPPKSKKHQIIKISKKKIAPRSSVYAQCRLRRRTVVSAVLASPPGELSSPQIDVLADWHLRCFVIFDCHFQYSVVSAEAASPQIGVSAILTSLPPQTVVSAAATTNCRLRSRHHKLPSSQIGVSADRCLRRTVVSTCELSSPQNCKRKHT